MFFMFPETPLVWYSDPAFEWAGLDLDGTPIFFDGAINWLSYVVFPCP